MTMRKVFPVCLFVFLSLLLAGLDCRSSWAGQITDANGEVVTFAQPFTRIISLYPAHSDNLVVLGAAAALIGVSEEDKERGIPIFSHHDGAEKFIAAKPDLVLIRPMIERANPDFSAALRRAGIAVVSLQPNTFDEMFGYWRALGLLTGREAAAEKMIADFQARLTALRHKVAAIPENKRQRVYFEAIHAKMKTFAADSIASTVLKEAGGINIAENADQVHETNIGAFGKERLLAVGDQIDVYLAQEGRMNPVTVAAIESEPGFQAIRAVREKRVYLLPEALIARPTPRLIEGMEKIYALLYLPVAPAQAAPHEKVDKTAIVLAVFGTTVPEALPGILNIRERIQKKFPQTEVRLAFTSNMIRKIWHKRQQDAAFQKANPLIPKDMYLVQGPLATIANLQDEGFTNILVQPGHITLGEEYLDLVSYIDGLNAIRTIKEKNQPFHKLVVSRPALGTMGPKYPYEEDINEVAKALADDAKEARESGSALLYMGHGNDYFPSSGSYLQLVQVMRDMYPGTEIYVTLVEGFPNLDLVAKQMKNHNVTKVLVKPFMVVAGDHAHNDMAGDDPDSMKSRLTKDGFQVTTIIKGLGEKDSFADVFVNHAAQTAQDNGISLK